MAWSARRRAGVVVSAALTLALGPFFVLQGAEGGTVADIAPQGIVVVGDSITARYDDEAGGARQGWWSMVGRYFGTDVDRYAESGSGYLRKGGLCDGTTFGQRPDALTGDAPSILILEGGRNDWAVCRSDRVTIASNAEISRAVNRYMTRVERALPNTRVVVLGPPWGPLQPLEGLRITSIVQQAAERHGFEFVDTTGTLTPDHVVDGIHPNRAGSTAIAKRVIAAL